MSAIIARFDPLLDEGDAREMLRIRRDHGGYGMYSEEGFDTGYAPGLPQRIDTIRNYLRTQDLDPADRDAVAVVAARTNYFRETYAYGEEVLAPGIEPFRVDPGLVEAATALFDRPLVVPAIVYANILVPGQELATHTDVPEFRGMNRKVAPQWLLVVMHHSGLFDRWRIPVATAVSYFGDGEGGALHHYPDGPDGPVDRVESKHNTAVLLDTDSVFHGVDRVTGGDQDAVTRLRPGQRLLPHSRSEWEVVERDGGGVVAIYDDAELRFSVSWKAYCFADEADRTRWKSQDDDLDLATVLDRLEEDLRDRGALRGPRPDPGAFGLQLVGQYVHFPSTAA